MWVRKNRLTAAVSRLKVQLAADPTAGDVVPRSGGLRKVRMAGAGRGKSGGFRVIYMLLLGSRYIALLDGYDKTEQEDLTADELKAIRALAEEIEVLLRRREEERGEVDG
jgi:hypothetical protein